MLGLKKCSEDDFNYFKGTNERYLSNLDKVVSPFFGFISLIIGVIFIGSLVLNLDQTNVLGIGTFISIIITILSHNINRLGFKRHIYKYQKAAVLVNIISVTLVSLTLYLFPLIFICNEKNKNRLIVIMLSAIFMGFIYVFILLISICKLIKNGETKNEECKNIYGKLGSKVLTIGIGSSIPVILVANKLSHIVVRQTNSNILSTLLVIMVAFIVQIVMSIFIPEGIILLYCKFRFESFNSPYKEEGSPVFRGVDKNKYKQPKKKRKH